MTHYNFLLLQIGHAFWLFLVTITKMDKMDRALDYDIELIANWKNYNKPRKLTALDVISFSYDVSSQLHAGAGFWSGGYDKGDRERA